MFYRLQTIVKGPGRKLAMEAEEAMEIAKITKQGLITIAFLVAVLWGCLVGERLTVQKANREMSGALREIGRLQVKVHHSEPAGTAPKRGTSV